MTEAVDPVKTGDIPPLDENCLTDEEKDASFDVEQDGAGKPEAKGKTSEILEGKREKKVVQRLNMQISSAKEKQKIESTGQGVKLGDIARINHSIGKLKAPLLKPLHKIVYDRPGAASSLRKNLRLFNGFPFEVDSDPYKKKLLKMARLPKTQLKTICQTLDLERSGKQSILVDRIMTFLLRPTDSGKPVLKKKKKKTTKDVKREKSSSKKKPQKKAESGKSRAIVTDSSSDDDDEDEDAEEKKEKSKITEKSTTASQKRKTSESQSSDKEEDDDDDEDGDDGEEEHDAPEEDSEEEESTQKSPRKKKSPAKNAVKKPEQKSEESTDDSDQCSQEDKTVKKTTKKPAAKRKAPAKPVPKTKKADSSSNRGKKTASKSKDESESSDDDQPLIKMIKKPPTDEQLKATIQDLLKDANLEEVTMKQLCRQVYDKFPDFDLTARKDYIKDTVKTLIS